MRPGTASFPPASITVAPGGADSSSTGPIQAISAPAIAMALPGTVLYSLPSGPPSTTSQFVTTRFAPSDTGHRLGLGPRDDAALDESHGGEEADARQRRHEDPRPDELRLVGDRLVDDVEAEPAVRRDPLRHH